MGARSGGAINTLAVVVVVETLAGASDTDKITCDACIEAVAAVAGLATGDCSSDDTVACGTIGSCACSTCTAERDTKAFCEVSAERSSNGSTCPSFSCSSSGSVPAPVAPPTDAPGDGPSRSDPAPVASPTDTPGQGPTTDAGTSPSAILAVASALLFAAATIM